MRDYFEGSNWSKIHAKKALPVLVNFAESGRATTYTELAKILLGDRKISAELEWNGTIDDSGPFNSQCL